MDPDSSVSVEPVRMLLTTPTRQSPVALVFIAWRFVRNLGVVNLVFGVVFVFSGRLPVALWAVGVVAVLLVFSIATASWWRFTFVVDGGELIVTKGIVRVERLIIPLDRVQSVGIDQKLLHRLFGVVSASVDTAGTSAAEFTIDAVERERAEALQHLVVDAAASATERSGVPDMNSEPTADEVLLRRTPRELVRIGLTRLPWAGLVALAPLIAASDELLALVGVDLTPDEQVSDGAVGEVGSAVVVLIAVGVFVAITVVGLALQVIQQIFTNWNLTLVRTSTGVRRTAGLLNTTSTASSLRRVQSITTDRSPPQRWFGIRRLDLTTVGEGTVTIPGATADEVERMRRLVLATTDPPAHDRMISSAYVIRAVRNTALVIVPLTIAGAFFVGWWTLSLLTLVAVRWLVARRRWRLRRWGLTADRIAESYRFVSEHTSEVELIKAQTVTVTRSFFERRRGLATVRVQHAQGFLAIPLIDHSDACAVRDLVLHAVESSRRPAM